MEAHAIVIFCKTTHRIPVVSKIVVSGTESSREIATERTATMKIEGSGPPFISQP